MKKLEEMKGKPKEEQIRMIKAIINEQEVTNKQLITKQLRLAKEFEKTQRKVVEA